MTKNDFIDILKAEFEEDKRNMLLENDEQEYTIKQAIIDYAEENEFDEDELEELAKYPNILQALYNIFSTEISFDVFMEDTFEIAIDNADYYLDDEED